MALNPEVTESSVERFYEDKGWKCDGAGNTVDAELWEDLRPCAGTYVSACRVRVGRFLPPKGEKILDAASGPIQYDEYLRFSEHFSRRTCVDISASALEQARKRIGAKGEFVKASLLALPFADDSFDAAISLHTIYHIEKSAQETAVRELVRVTRPGAPLVIVYANPDKLLSRIKRLFRKPPAPESGPIYYFAHPLSWWNRFRDVAEVELHPWRSLTAQDAKRLIPGGAFGRFLYAVVFRLEELFPGLAVRLGAYPIVLLKKRG